MNASKRASKYVATIKRENERLRAAMVHAMDDCEAAADHKGNPVSTKSVLQQVAARLRAVLEAKP